MSPQRRQSEEERRAAERAALRHATRTQSGPPAWVVRAWAAKAKDGNEKEN